MKRKNARGLTFIEVLVAMAILALALLALIPMFAMSVRVNAASNQLSTANSLAREKLEELIEFPSTNSRLQIPATANNATYPNDLPAFYNPKTGVTASTMSAGLIIYPYSRTYTVKAVDSTLATPPTLSSIGSEAPYEGTNNPPLPYYALKLVTVTVQPTSGPFPGLRRTVQSAYVRFRNGNAS